MAKKINNREDASALRQRAEAKIAMSPEELAAMSPEETRRMLHELLVHQVELEMQNEELRQTQAELDAARVRYFELYDHAPVGYCTLSEQGVILEANFTASSLLGIARGASARISRFILKEDQDVYYLCRKQLFETGKPQTCELRMVKKDGTVFWAHLATTVARDANGNLVCRVTLDDITERKQAEEARKENMVLQRIAGEMAKLGGWSVDLGNNRLFWSDEVAAIHEMPAGYAPTVVEGINFYAPEWREKIIKLFTDCAKKGIPYNEEMEIITTGGKRVWVQTIGNAIRDDSGKIIKVQGAFQDISERKQAEAALRGSEKKYSSLFNSMLEGFALHEIICDAGGKPADYRFLDINPAFERLTGLKKADVVGKTVLTLLPETEHFWIENYGNVALTGEPVSFEHYTGTLKRHYQIIAFCPQKNQFAVIFTDITERKFQEEARELTAHLIVQINTPSDFREHISKLTASLQNWSGCEAVGIRLRDGDDYPYYETRGFPAEFVQAENSLCECDRNGKIRRDSNGNPVLECMCGNILRGRFDPAKPFFTAHGSFWTNNTTALLAGTTDADCQARTRNRCNGEGYESVALIPLRVGQQVFGLLQFNDHRPDRFTPYMIEHFEKMADNLAIALSQRQTEEALRLSEARFRGYFELPLEGRAISSPDTHWLDVNSTLCEMFGYTRAELTRMKWADLSHPDDMAANLAQFNRVMNGEIDGYTLDKRFIHKDGHIVFTHLAVQCLRRPDRSVDFFMSVFLDISDRKRAEEKLRESEHLLSKAQEIAHLGSWSLDLIANRLTWSDEIYRIFGLRQQEFRATYEAFLDAVHPEDRAAVNSAYSDSIEKGKDSYEIEHRIIRRHTGELRYVYEKCRHIKDASGRIIRSEGMVHDITVRKLAELELKNALAEARRFREALDHVPAYIFMKDTQFRYTYANRQTLEFIGCSAGELSS